MIMSCDSSIAMCGTADIAMYRQVQEVEEVTFICTKVKTDGFPHQEAKVLQCHFTILAK